MSSHCLKWKKIYKKLKVNEDLLKKQAEKGIVSSLGLQTPLSKVPLLGNILL